MNTDEHLRLADPLAHVESIRLRDDWLVVCVPTLFVLCVAGAFLCAAILQAWHEAFRIFFGLVIVSCGIVISQASLTQISASQKNSARFDEWRANLEQLRQNSAARIEAETQAQRITVKGDATIGQTVNQVNVGEMSDYKALVMSLSHQREFRERVAKLHEQRPDDTGVELKYWLQNYGAFADYQFSDSKRITQREHKLLADSLKPLGEYPEGRRQGSSGRAVKVIGEE